MVLTDKVDLEFVKCDRWRLIIKPVLLLALDGSLASSPNYKGHSLKPSTPVFSIIGLNFSLIEVTLKETKSGYIVSSSCYIYKSLVMNETSTVKLCIIIRCFVHSIMHCFLSERGFPNAGCGSNHVSMPLSFGSQGLIVWATRHRRRSVNYQ